MNVKRKRIWEIDFLRGFALFMMIFDHFMYDLTSFPEGVFHLSLKTNDSLYHLVRFANYYWDHLRTLSLLNLNIKFKFVYDLFSFLPQIINEMLLRFIGLNIHYMFAILFFIISGISTSFSRSSLKRSLQVLLGAYLITMVTIIVGKVMDYDGIQIVFGVLQCIGFSMLIYSLIQLLIKNKYVDLGIGIIFILFYLMIPSLGIDPYTDYPNNIFNLGFYKAILGMGRLPSADFFSLVPWFGFFMIGVYLGKTLYQDKKSRFPNLDGKWHAFFSFLGRNSIWVYLLHQIVIFMVMVLLILVLGYQIHF